MFDDVEECEKSPDFVQLDIVEESDNVVEETDQQDIKSPDHMHLLPIKKTERRIRSKHLENNISPNFNFDGLSEEVSLFTTPSLFSLVSTHDNLDSIRGTKKVTILFI